MSWPQDEVECGAATATEIIISLGASYNSFEWNDDTCRLTTVTILKTPKDAPPVEDNEVVGLHVPIAIVPNGEFILIETKYGDVQHLCCSE